MEQQLELSLGDEKIEAGNMTLYQRIRYVAALEGSFIDLGRARSIAMTIILSGPIGDSHITEAIHNYAKLGFE